MSFQLLILLILVGGIWVFKRLVFDMKRKRRIDYYRNTYLKSDEWKRKRFVVLKRDNWKCVECNNDKSTLHIHHEEYSGCDPWDTPDDKLKTLCKDCHSKKGSKINQIELFLEKIGVKFRINPTEQIGVSING